MQKLNSFNFFHLYNLILGLIIILIMTMIFSCTATKNSAYFRTLPKDTTINSYVNSGFESKIQKNDILGISVSSLNEILDQQFNTLSKISTGGIGNVQTSIGFMVNDLGEINLHFIGNIKVEGLTRKELKHKLEKDLLPFMKEPIVTVQYLNKKVTILGNVASPKVLYLSEEQMPLLEVIVNCGDLSEAALASDIMIIRDSSSHKIIKHVNLEDHSLFSSSWYFIQPDDVIYVKKDIKTYNKEERLRSLQTTISLIATIVSLFLVVYNIITR